MNYGLDLFVIGTLVVFLLLAASIVVIVKYFI